MSVLDPGENSDVIAKHFADMLYYCTVQSQLVPSYASSTDLASDFNISTSRARCK